MTKKSKKIAIIVNPISGDKPKDQLVEEINVNLRDNFELHIQYSEYPGHASELSQMAVENGAKAVIAVGGDGTVNEVARSLVKTKVALGIIPTGSGNGFARHLKIDMNSDKAIDRIKRFKKRKIDTGLANGIPFLATAGFGFDAHVAHKFADFGKRGFLAYMQVSSQEFIGYEPRHYELEIDGKKISEEALLITAANAGQYGNNVWIAPSASVSDGLLNFSILQKFPVALLPDIILRLLNKSIEKSRYYKKIQGKELKVKGLKQFHIDGEPMFCDGNLQLSIAHKSLKVIC